jgi:glycosyltransferase involved in cell wall biosynthesis
MPAYNAGKYIKASIDSVLAQTWTNWELLIIDNNSTDNTRQLVSSIQDSRINVLHEPRQGVSHARNLGLACMQGDFFCFLDADDLFTPDSLALRMTKFQSADEIGFVDGRVCYMDANGVLTGRTYLPAFEGNPRPLLLRLDSRCVFGPSWMIRRQPGFTYHFETDMTHAEDLYFYLSISGTGVYTYVDAPILHYRQHDTSAMRNLRGLENGYALLLYKVKERYSSEYDPYLKRRIIRIMFLSWLVNGRNPIQAICSFFRLLRA